METDKNKNNPSKRTKPDSNANPNPVPKNASNTANFKGGVDLGTSGTKPTASQQQGQGSWRAKDKDNRSDSKS